MYNFRSYRENWNEFQWEKELRRDERRISYYFGELPLYLDLPGEEDAIFDGMMGHPDLVPSDMDPDSWLREWNRSSDEDDDDDGGFAALRRRPNYDMIEQTDKLSTEWNVLYASLLDDRYTEFGLAGGCQFGKLLGRIADLIDSEEHSALRISLGKRVIADINDLIGLLHEVIQLRSDLLPQILLFCEMLQHLRERTVELLKQARGQA